MVENIIYYNSTLLNDGRYINNETGEIYGGNKNIKKDNKVVLLLLFQREM